jgi:hypothetical protein
MKQELLSGTIKPSDLRIFGYTYLLYCQDYCFFVSPCEELLRTCLQCDWEETCKISPIKYPLNGIKYGTSVRIQPGLQHFAHPCQARKQTLNLLL